MTPAARRPLGRGNQHTSNAWRALSSRVAWGALGPRGALFPPSLESFVGPVARVRKLRALEQSPSSVHTGTLCAMKRACRLQLSLLAVLSSQVAAQEAPARDPAAQMEALRVKHGVPALGGALVTLDGVAGVWVAGNRSVDCEEKVTPDDLWHLGSCTKAMTATLIALLVTRGDLSWEAPLGELLPDFATEMDVDFMDLTLVDLMSHRAGLPANFTDDLDASLEKLSLIEQRSALTRSVLKGPPVHPPRGAILYSNAGFVIAGHLAEVATKKPWETLMQELLFTPLGMTSAGFGPPGVRDACDQPRGHTADGRALEPGPEADNQPSIGPAGTVHATLADWAKFLQLHLRGMGGDVKVGELTLTRETFTRLHTACPGPGPQYGYGWVFEKRPWAGGDGTTLTHSGSNGMWCCETWLSPTHGFATLAVTNLFTEPAQHACFEVTRSMVAQAEARRAR